MQRTAPLISSFPFWIFFSLDIIFLSWIFFIFKNFTVISAVLGLHCCPQAFSSCSKRGLLSSCDARARVSCWEAQGLGERASLVGARRARELRLSSCGTPARLLLGTGNPAGPRTAPVPPALAGGVPATGPPRKSFLPGHLKVSLLPPSWALPKVWSPQSCLDGYCSLLPGLLASRLVFLHSVLHTATKERICLNINPSLALHHPQGEVKTLSALIPADLSSLNSYTRSTYTLQIPNFWVAFCSAPDWHQSALRNNKPPLPPTSPSSLRALGICWPALQVWGIIYHSLSKSFLIRTHFQTVNMKSNRWLKTLQDGLVHHMTRPKKKNQNKTSPYF